MATEKYVAPSMQMLKIKWSYNLMKRSTWEDKAIFIAKWLNFQALQFP